MAAEGPVFAMPDKLVPMLRADLRRACARWIRATPDRAERRARRDSAFLREYDAEGRVFDFHALRNTYITLVVKSGASVKEAQDLARHSDPKLTMNVYTKLGVHDLATALDRLPSPTTVSPVREVARATGTHDLPFEDPRQYTRQWQRDPAQVGATPRKRESGAPVRLVGGNPLPDTAQDNAARPDAASCDKATRETRTRDLSFTKAPLYQLS